MRIRMACVAGLLACTAAPAAAQWAPLWTAVAVHAAGARDVRLLDLVAVDGGVLVLAEENRIGRTSVVLARIEEDGRFAWLREQASSRALGMRRLGDRHVAVAAFDPALVVHVRDVRRGELVHACDWNDGTDSAARRSGSDLLAETAGGGLLLGSVEGAGFVVWRCAGDGSALPAWRGPTGVREPTISSIVSTADGGAVIAVSGGFGEGYVVLRIDADGAIRFVDREGGDLGNPLTPACIAVDGDDAVLVVAGPESASGVARAQVWKIDAQGHRSWLNALAPPVPLVSFEVTSGLLLAPDGDVLVAPSLSAMGEGFRLVRIDGVDGHLRWNTRTSGTRVPSALALATNGRAAMAGYEPEGFGGVNRGRVVEFSANGSACRRSDGLELLGALQVAAAEGGWFVAGIRIDGDGFPVLGVQRYDDSGACDTLFDDGFDALPDAGVHAAPQA